jgi:hypothetical protein
LVNKRNRLRLLVLGVIGIVAAAAVWLLFPRSSDPTIKLADGRQLTIKGVTFGTEHRWVFGKPWAKALAPIIPVPWRSRLGVTVLERKANSPVLMVWVETRNLGPYRFPPSDAAVNDAHGFETEPTRPAVSGFPQPAVSIQGWDFSNFPRHAKTLELKLYQRNRAIQPVLQGRFTIPNPAPQPSPTETAPTLPVSVTNGGVEFTLLSFAIEQRIPDQFRPIGGWITPWSTAKFRVTQQGEPAGLWKVESVQITATSGNIVQSTGFVSVATGTEPVVQFDGALWPEEPAWKLRAEFSRLSNFAPDALWSVPGIAVPKVPGQTMINTQTVIAGIEISAQTLRRYTANGLASFGGLLTGAEVTLYVVPPDQGRLSLARAVDDRGRELRHVPGYANHRGAYSFWLELPANSSRIDFTFALRQSRFIEFVARPTVLEKQ